MRSLIISQLLYFFLILIFDVFTGQRPKNQVRGLVNVWSISVDSIIECIPPMVTILLQVASYFNLIFNTGKFKDILLFIKNDHNYYMNRPENMILQYYARQGSKIIFYYVSYIYITITAFVLIPTVSLINELINHSEERSLPIEIDYGIDIQEYFYYLFIPLYISMFIVPHVIASCDTTYLLYVHHANALFAIVSYELKTIHIFDTSSLINLKDYDLLEKYKDVELSPDEQKKIFKKLLLCIRRHQNAIRYSNLVESFFTKSILAQMFCNVVSLSIGGVETILNLGNTRNAMRFGALALAQAIHIFILCFPGQTLLNHSEEVYTAACEVVWYIFPKRCHNLYMFLLTRTMIFNKITAFKLSVMSMETFLSIIQTAMSYFTVLLSTT